MMRDEKKSLAWQSKAVLLIVVPWTVASVLLQAHWWWTQVPVVAYETLGISGLFGLIVWRLKAGTPAAAATGAAITASLMFSTARYPYEWSWLHGGLMPLLAVFLLTFAATKIGRARKEKLGTAEAKRGRNAAQVAANLGVAALAVQLLKIGETASWDLMAGLVAVAVLAEAAADTVSSEIGQVFGGQPRMITTLRIVEPGTDGAITLAGTFAGVLAAAIVATVGIICASIGPLCASNVSGCDIVTSGFADHILMISIMTTAGSFGLLFDSLLGATLERRGWLNNDAVNFLSTLSAVVFSMAIAAVLAASVR